MPKAARRGEGPPESAAESAESAAARDCLRASVVLSLLTGRPLSLRLRDPIRPFEASLLKLVTVVTDGSRAELERLSIRLTPGRLVGGDLSFECDASVPLSYYLEPLVMLLPFAAGPSQVTLKHCAPGPPGAESDDGLAASDCFSSLECFCSVATVLLQLIGCEVSFKYKEPHEVRFACAPVRRVPPITLAHSPRVKRVRGTVVVRSLQPALGKSAIVGAKRVLDAVCDNTWVALASPPGRFRPTLIVSLVAEGAGCVFTASSVFTHAKYEAEAAPPRASLRKIAAIAMGTGAPGGANGAHCARGNDTAAPRAGGATGAHCADAHSGARAGGADAGKPSGLAAACERVGEACARRLCSEVALDAVADSAHQHLLLFFMALSGDHAVSRARVARLTRHSVRLLRLLRDRLGVVFRFEEAPPAWPSAPALVAKCVGANYQNIGVGSF